MVHRLQSREQAVAGAIEATVVPHAVSFRYTAISIEAGFSVQCRAEIVEVVVPDDVPALRPVTPDIERSSVAGPCAAGPRRLSTSGSVTGAKASEGTCFLPLAELLRPA